MTKKTKQTYSTVSSSVMKRSIKANINYLSLEGFIVNQIGDDIYECVKDYGKYQIRFIFDSMTLGGNSPQNFRRKLNDAISFKLSQAEKGIHNEPI